MNARNLRIGNLIDTISRSTPIHLPVNIPFKIYEISHFDVSVYDPNINPATLSEMVVFGVENVCGLVLTEDWLIKLGFKRLDKYSFVKSTVFIHHRKRGFVYGSRKCEVLLGYVHEVQNLYFALTKQELDIKSN